MGAQGDETTGYCTLLLSGPHHLHKLVEPVHSFSMDVNVSYGIEKGLLEGDNVR